MRLPNTDGSGNKILLPLFGCLPVIWLAVLFAQAIQPGMGLTEMMGSLTAALSNPFALTWTERTPKCILLFLLAYGMGIGIYWSNRRNYRRGEEHGSAVWGDTGQIVKRYQAPKYEDNLLLTRRFRMGLDGHKHKRNLNVLVVGGSGAGKTRYYARPNIMQGNCSFIITDPKAELLRSTGNLLKSKGYEVRVFDLINPEASMCYNPFRYIDDDKDVLRLISNLIKNTTPKGSHESDPFWTKAETALLQALMLYLIREAPEDEQTFAMILEMISSAEVREDDETFQSPLDLLFENLENRDPLNIAVKQYKVFKQAAGVVCSKRLLNQAVGKSLRTHNLKPKKGAQVMRKNEKITALYERLSRDDFGKDDDQQRESNSISNQKAMLEEFAARQGFTNIVHFTDDGISGTCFDRPGFLAMMKEVEAGNVEYLCIKDYCAIIGLNQKDLENQGILA